MVKASTLSDKMKAIDLSSSSPSSSYSSINVDAMADEATDNRILTRAKKSRIDQELASVRDKKKRPEASAKMTASSEGSTDYGEHQQKMQIEKVKQKDEKEKKSEGKNENSGEREESIREGIFLQYIDTFTLFPHVAGIAIRP